MSSSSEHAPRASIVLVTRNHADLLADALATILADSSTVSRELLVVDNGSTDRTREVVAAASADAPFAVRLLEEPVPGHSRGRNRALAEARGEIALFTDDDVLVDDGWADALCRPFADPQVGVVSGRTLPLWPHEPPGWLHGEHERMLALFDHGPESRALEEDEYAAGANMAIRLSALGRFAEPFDLTLGHAGDRRFAYDETHLLDQLRPDHAFFYAADAVVQHRVAARRMELEWLRGAYFDRGAAIHRMKKLRETVPAVPRVRAVVRAARGCRSALAARRRADAAPRTPESTFAELSTYAEAGRLVENAFGRLPGLSRLIRDQIS